MPRWPSCTSSTTSSTSEFRKRHSCLGFPPSQQTRESRQTSVCARRRPRSQGVDLNGSPGSRSFGARGRGADAWSEGLTPDGGGAAFVEEGDRAVAQALAMAEQLRPAGLAAAGFGRSS